MKSTHYTGKRRGRGEKDFQGGATGARQSTSSGGGDFTAGSAHPPKTLNTKLQLPALKPV